MRLSPKLAFAAVAVVLAAGVIALVMIAQPKALASLTGGGHPRPSPSCDAGYHRPCPPSPRPSTPAPSPSPSASVPPGEPELPATGSSWLYRVTLAGVVLVVAGLAALAGSRRRRPSRHRAV